MRRGSARILGWAARLALGCVIAGGPAACSGGVYAVDIDEADEDARTPVQRDATASVDSTTPNADVAPDRTRSEDALPPVDAAGSDTTVPDATVPDATVPDATVDTLGPEGGGEDASLGDAGDVSVTAPFDATVVDVPSGDATPADGYPEDSMAAMDAAMDARSDSGGYDASDAGGDGASSDTGATPDSTMTNGGAFFIGGNIHGLAGGDSVTLQFVVPGFPTTTGTWTVNGAFDSPSTYPNGAKYTVTVSGTTDAGESCAAFSGSGVIQNANVTTVAVDCVTGATYIEGLVYGTTMGNAVSIVNATGESTMAGGSDPAPFVFPTAIANGQGVTLMAIPPPGWKCYPSMLPASAPPMGPLAFYCGLPTSAAIQGLEPGEMLTVTESIDTASGPAPSVVFPVMGSTTNTQTLLAPIGPGDSYSLTLSPLTGAGPYPETCAVGATNGGVASTVASPASTIFCGNTLSLQVTSEVDAAIDESCSDGITGAQPQTINGSGTVSFLSPVPSGASYTVTCTNPANAISCVSANAGANSGVMPTAAKTIPFVCSAP